MLKVCWFSSGVSSFVACYLTPDIDRIVYIDVANQHPDSMRFVRDSEKLLGKPIEIIRSERYGSVDEVIEKRRYINGPAGAACTLELKKRVREEWERKNIAEPVVYVWGYDSEEAARAERLRAHMIEFQHEFPLIDRGLTKADAHAICADLGLNRPAMYDLGYSNNNCIGCVKGGKGYWNKIRRDFPDVFSRRAAQERLIGHCCIKGVFLDELPEDAGNMADEIPQDCSISCYLAEIDAGISR